MKDSYKNLILLLISGVALFAIFFTLGWLYAAFFLIGFIAQLVDGSLGMGFGLTSTAALLVFGISPAAISGSVHTAETFSSLASGVSHFKLKNVDKALFYKLMIPGAVAALAGAILLILLKDFNNQIIRGVVAVYVGILGIRLIILFIRRSRPQRSTRINVRMLAAIGGFLDSFGGGGWGPIVTTTLTTKGEHEPRKVIGSVNAAEFFVSLANSLTLLLAIGLSNWRTIVALGLGGVIAAPSAAKITSKVSARYLTLSVGILVIIWSLYVVAKII